MTPSKICDVVQPALPVVRTIAMSFVLDAKFVSNSVVQADARGRVEIGASEQNEEYHLSVNSRGQILLTPLRTIPEREVWLWRNPEAMESVRRGLEESAAGHVSEPVSFAQYADIEIDEE